MSYVIQPIIGVNLAALGNGDGTTAGALVPQYAVGTRVVANDGVYQYVKALGTVALYDLVKISNAFAVGSATSSAGTYNIASTEPAKLGVANQTAFIVNQYGWVFIGPGLVTVNVALNCVQDVKLYGTTTAGVVDDTSAGGLISGLKLITTITTAAASPCIAECEMGVLT